MGVSTELPYGVSLLNQWFDNCGSAAALSAADVPAGVRKQLPADWDERLKAVRFSQRDGAHLRDCMLFKQLNSYAVGQAESERIRVLNLFDHVVRAVSLVDEHPDNLPLAAY